MKSDRLEAALDHYIRLRQTTLRPLTIRTVRNRLQLFIRYLREQHPEVRDFSNLRRVPHIEAYITHLAPRLRPASLCNDLCILQHFFTEMIQWQWPEAPPDGLITPADFPRREQTLPKPLPAPIDQAVQAILKQHTSLHALGLRLLRATGLRNGEMYQLAHDALTATADGHFALRVPPVKTYRERLIPLASETVELLEAIRRQRGQRRAPPPPAAAYLMVNEWGRHLQPKVYAEALKRWTQHLCPQSIHPHRLRHTFATQMARAGMSLQALMKILGHRKPQMSLQYIALSGTDLQLAYDQALATLKTLNAVQPKLPPSFTATTPTTFDELFQTLIRQLETLRRDARHNTPLARELQRFVKRLRKTRDDLTPFLK
jgi:site-specific recombinase XerD